MLIKAVFYFMGLTVVGEIAFLLLVTILSAGHYSMHVPFLTVELGVRFAIGFVVLVVVGVGLFKLRKWAALAYSLMMMWMAYLMFMGSIHSVPWSWGGIGFWFAILFMFPLVATIVFWKALTWFGNA